MEDKKSIMAFIERLKSVCRDLGLNIKDNRLIFIAPFDGLTPDKGTSIRIILDDNCEKWDHIEDVKDIEFVDVGESGRECIVFGDGSIAINEFPLEDVQLMFRCCSFGLSKEEFEAIFYVREELLNLIKEMR